MTSYKFFGDTQRHGCLALEIAEARQTGLIACERQRARADLQFCRLNERARGG